MMSKDINERSPWQDITEGNQIYEAATSRAFCTGGVENLHSCIRGRKMQTVSFVRAGLSGFFHPGQGGKETGF